jgi:hypothetical protein
MLSNKVFLYRWVRHRKMGCVQARGVFSWDSVRPRDSPERAPDSLANQGSYRPPLGKSGEGLEVSFALPWSYGRVPGFVHTTTPSNPASTIASGSDSPRQSEQSISGSVTTESVSPNRRLTMLQYTSQLNSFEELMFENIWACPGPDSGSGPGGRHHPRLNRLDYCRCFDVALATPRYCLFFPRPAQPLCCSAVPYESILTRRTDPGSSQNGKASREPWAVALEQYLQNLESLLMSEGHSLEPPISAWGKRPSPQKYRYHWTGLFPT